MISREIGETKTDNNRMGLGDLTSKPKYVRSLPLQQNCRPSGSNPPGRILYQEFVN